MDGKRGVIRSSLIALALGAFAAEACSGRSVEHQAGDAGTRAFAGSGPGSGASGGTDPSTGARSNDSGGRGGTAGRATNGGRGGSRAGAGAGGASGAPAGGGGSAGQPDVDPDCQCQADDFEFSCTLSLDALAGRLHVPDDCENDLDLVLREPCSGGYTRYRWFEGGENDYVRIEDANGKLVYASASGYVNPGCSGDPLVNDYGSFHAGVAPNVTCEPGCAVCGDRSFGGDATSWCATCTELGNERAAVSLADYCAYTHCPATIDEARYDATSGCGTRVVDADMTTSCGVVSVRHAERARGVSYFFDAGTKKLTGIVVRAEAAEGPCSVRDTDVGQVPTACQLESDCSLCDAGLGGEGGAGGADGKGTGLGGGAPELAACSPP
jgi:hypothetical protein